MLTNAGRTIWICSTPQPYDLSNAQYAALTWVQVLAIGELGETGLTTNILTYDTWGDNVIRKQKGMSNAGDPSLEVARIIDDPGQMILRSIANNTLEYAVRISDPDTLEADGERRYLRGLIMGPTRPNGRNEDFDLEVFTLALNRKDVWIFDNQNVWNDAGFWDDRMLW